MKHTPGPWKFAGAVQTMDGAYVCDLSSPRGAAERDANGHLIAAAPELYNSLIELLEPLERASAEMVAHGCAADENVEAAFDRARAAIAKARGAA